MLRPGPEMEQLVVRLMRLVERGEEMFVNSALALAVSVALNCVDQHRPGDLTRFPAVLSRQEPLQEENLGGEEGCEGPLGPPVTSCRCEGLVTLQ